MKNTIKKLISTFICSLTLLALTGCGPADWDEDLQGPEPEGYAEQKFSTKVENEEPNLMERWVEDRLLLPKKEDLVGRWEGYLVYDYANSTIIDLEESDTNLVLEFYLEGDQLMVKTKDSVAPVEYTAHEKERISEILFTIISYSDQEGVEAPPAQMTFSNEVWWKKNETTKEYVLEMSKKGKFNWQWGEGIAIGTWLVEKK